MELAVHKKKIEEVENWIRSHVESKNMYKVCLMWTGVCVIFASITLHGAMFLLRGLTDSDWYKDIL